MHGEPPIMPILTAAGVNLTRGRAPLSGSCPAQRHSSFVFMCGLLAQHSLPTPRGDTSGRSRNCYRQSAGPRYRRYGGRGHRTGGVLSAVDEAQQVAPVEVGEPVGIVDHQRVFSEPVCQLSDEFETRSIGSARMSNRTSSGVDTAVYRGPVTSRNGCRPAGHGVRNSRSQSAAPVPVTQVSSPSGIRKAH